MRLLIVTILSMMVLSAPVMAEELKTPGMLPDNLFYPVKIFFEKIRMTFTFGSESKAKLHVSFAEQRLAELNATIEKGKLQYVEKLKINYEKELNETEKEIKHGEELGKNVTLLSEHVSNMTYKHIFVLERVLEKVPESAKPAIEHAMNVSIRGHENAVERIITRINKTAVNISCTIDADCINSTICPMVIGSDTPICDDGKCKCGAKWEITNKTEWKERFKEEWTNKTQNRIEKIKENVPLVCAQVITYKLRQGKCFECPDACTALEKCKGVQSTNCR